MIRQLVFDLPSPAAMTREDFFVAPSNALALQAVEHWESWPGRKLLLVGPDGAGKTHLARIWAVIANAVVLSAGELADADVAGLAGRAVAVEDADRIGPAETQLFHLHNLVTTAGALLLTARTPPRDWGLGLPDLISRMQATPIAQMPRSIGAARALGAALDARALALGRPITRALAGEILGED